MSHLRRDPQQGLVVDLAHFSRLYFDDGSDDFFDVPTQNMLRAGGMKQFLAHAVLLNGKSEVAFTAVEAGKECASDSAELRHQRVPREEVKRFQNEMQSLLNKANDPATNDRTRQIITQFRLPDPDLDPQFYRTFSASGRRRILVLWGSESHSGSSLPPLEAIDKLYALTRGKGSMLEKFAWFVLLPAVAVAIACVIWFMLDIGGKKPTPGNGPVAIIPYQKPLEVPVEEPAPELDPPREPGEDPPPVPDPTPPPKIPVEDPTPVPGPTPPPKIPDEDPTPVPGPAPPPKIPVEDPTSVPGPTPPPKIPVEDPTPVPGPTPPPKIPGPVRPRGPKRSEVIIHPVEGNSAGGRLAIRQIDASASDRIKIEIYYERSDIRYEGKSLPAKWSVTWRVNQKEVAKQTGPSVELDLAPGEYPLSATVHGNEKDFECEAKITVKANKEYQLTKPTR